MSPLSLLCLPRHPLYAGFPSLPYLHISSLDQPPFKIINTILYLLITVNIHHILLLLLLLLLDSLLQHQTARQLFLHDGEMCDEAAEAGEDFIASVEDDTFIGEKKKMMLNSFFFHPDRESEG